MKIKSTSRVDAETIEAYSEIDGLVVIEELLLYKGCDIVIGGAVWLKDLDDMALVCYNLKVNATNRLYVGMRLDKFYHRNSLKMTNGRVRVPQEIYDRVKELNDSYKTKDNQIN